MDEAAVTRYVTTAFDQVHVHTSEDGTSYFFYEPDRMFPFATSSPMTPTTPPPT